MNELMQEKSLEVASILKTLGHQKRLLILCTLADGEKSVGDIEKICGAAQSQVSQFLKRMEAEGLINHRREGNYVYYVIKDKRIEQLIQTLGNIFCK